MKSQQLLAGTLSGRKTGWEESLDLAESDIISPHRGTDATCDGREENSSPKDTKRQHVTHAPKQP